MVLIFINPLSANFELKYESLLNKKIDSIYSIKISENDMWIKNKISNLGSNYINIENIDLNKMEAENIKILSISDDNIKFILAKKGQIYDQNFSLKDVNFFNISNDNFINLESYDLKLNFTKENVLSSILNYLNLLERV